MPFKQGKTYFTERKLPGYGTLRRTSLGTTRAADARALEAAILEVHRRGIHDPKLFVLLDELQGAAPGKRGTVEPADILVAVRAPDGTEAGLARLLQSIDDPPLSETIEARLAGTVSREERIALPNVAAAAEAELGEGCATSILLDPIQVERVLRRVESDSAKQPASVVRYEKTAISKLLVDRYGRHQRDQTMKSVRYSGGDDRRRLRDQVVTGPAIRRLCDELERGYWKPGDEAAPLYVRLACTTGATVSPLSRALVRQWNGETGVLHLVGTKRAKKAKGTVAGARSRDRDIRVPPQLVPEVEAYAVGANDDRLFPLVYTRFGSMWKRAVKRAELLEAVVDGRGNLVPMTPHDLRRVFSLFARTSGLSAEKIGQAGLGHDRIETTNRYIRSQTSIAEVEARAVADALGF